MKPQNDDNVFELRLLAVLRGFSIPVKVFSRLSAMNFNQFTAFGLTIF